MGIPEFERFFREAASLDVDKDDLKRFSDFIHQKIADMLVIALARANANGRDVIDEPDLPITKGLQERIHEYRKLGQNVDVGPFLERMATWPQLDLALSEDVRDELPNVAGGLGVALAKSFKILDTGLKNPSTEHWDRAFGLFDLLL
jgi:hypothetical protein